MLLREVFSFVVGSYVPCKCTHKLLSVQKIKIQRTFQVALVIETVTSVSITGKFETLGSNFSHETEGLLASSATTIGKSISTISAFVDPLHCIVSDKLNQEHKN